MYSTRTVTVTVSYTDTLTERGWGREWQYVYSTRTATVTVSYTDTLTERGWGRDRAVRVQYTYCHSYCVLHGYSDRAGVGEREWQYVYSTRTVTVTVSYTDTLTEGGRRESGSMCTVHDNYCVLHGYSDRGG